MGSLQPTQMVAIAFVIFFAIGIHEYAHCKFADMAGDPTPRIYGRVTLNLFKHFELVGTIMMVLTMATGYGIGWGKPAPMDERKMRNPRWDLFSAVAAGPVSNLLQALVYGVIGQVLIRSGQLTQEAIIESMGGYRPDLIGAIIGFGVTSNLSLAFFNLLPIAPLDGHWLVGQILSGRARDKWYLFSRRYGFFILLGLVLGGPLIGISFIGMILRPIVLPLVRILLGF